MKSLNTLIVSSLALGSLSLTQAANVATTSLAAPALKITQSDGSNLAAGSIVRVGYFDLTGVGGDTTILKVGLYSALEAIFKAVGENGASIADGDTGPVVTNAAGGFIGSIQNIDNGFMPGWPGTVSVGLQHPSLLPILLPECQRQPMRPPRIGRSSAIRVG